MSTETNATPYPDPEIEISHAEPGIVEFFKKLYESKNSGSPERFAAEFSDNLLTYTDAVLGWQLNSHAALKATLEQFMPNWKYGRAYPLRIIGGPNSAILSWTDTPELFGDEIHGFGAVDLVDGKVVRWVDYWDSTSFNHELFDRMAVPDEQYPVDFQYSALTDGEPAAIVNVVDRLQTALYSSDLEAIASLFSFSARFEDAALRTLITGRAAIARYISRLRGEVPYGTGSHVRHVLGGPTGGGYEWIARTSSNVRSGITAIELDQQNQISRLTTIYDARRLPDDLRLRLVLFSQED